MNKLTLMIIVLWVSVIIYCVLPHDKLPPISLPKGAQHNTFGELPFVEVMDDGDFYEEDGEEYYQARWNFSFKDCISRNPDNLSKRKMREFCTDLCEEWVHEKGYVDKFSLGINKCRSRLDVAIGGLTGNLSFQ